MTAIASGAPARVKAGSFYAWMAAACVATAFLGFIPTYWQPMAAGQFAANPIVHLHGIVMFGWTLFFLAQTSLVPTGNTALHRQVGLAGISLATLVTVIGLLAALNSERNGVAGGQVGPNEAFLIVPLEAIAQFAVLFILAIANIRRTDYHKRYMLLATVSLLGAPVARPLIAYIYKFPPADALPVWLDMPAVWLSLIIVAAAMVYDWRTLGKPHRVYQFAVPIIIFLAWAVLPMSQTPVWHDLARGYLALGGPMPPPHG